MTEPSARTAPAPGPVLPATPLIVVTGKGGVGRSSAAAALAQVLGQTGARVALAHPVDAPPPHRPAGGVRLVPLDTESIMARYLEANLPGPFAMAIKASRAFRLVTAATPGSPSCSRWASSSACTRRRALRTWSSTRRPQGTSSRSWMRRRALPAPPAVARWPGVPRS